MHHGGPISSQPRLSSGESPQALSCYVGYSWHCSATLLCLLMVLLYQTDSVELFPLWTITGTTEITSFCPLAYPNPPKCVSTCFSLLSGSAVRYKYHSWAFAIPGKQRDKRQSLACGEVSAAFLGIPAFRNRSRVELLMLAQRDWYEGWRRSLGQSPLPQPLTLQLVSKPELVKIPYSAFTAWETTTTHSYIASPYFHSLAVQLAWHIFLQLMTAHGKLKVTALKHGHTYIGFSKLLSPLFGI